MSNWNPVHDNECDHCGQSLDAKETLEADIARKVKDSNKTNRLLIAEREQVAKLEAELKQLQSDHELLVELWESHT